MRFGPSDQPFFSNICRRFYWICLTVRSWPFLAALSAQITSVPAVDSRCAETFRGDDLTAATNQFIRRFELVAGLSGR